MTRTDPFFAKLTARTTSGGLYVYEWVEYIWNGTDSAFQAVDSPRSGSYAYETNNILTDVDSFVWLMYAGYNVQGETVYVFDAPGGSLSASGITAKESDGSPSYSDVDSLEFDQDDGFVLTQPGTARAKISLADASASQAGIVNTTTQTIAGNKTFTGVILVTGGLQAPASASFTIDSGQVLTVTGPGAFSITAQFRTPPFSFSISNGANHNLNVTGAGKVIRLTGPSAAWSITGLGTPTPADGDSFYLLNATGQTGTIKHQDAGSTASFRIICPGGADAVIADGGAFSLDYDGTSSRWRLTAAAQTPISSFGLSLTDDPDAATARTTLGLGTIDTPQFSGIEVGNASDTTLARLSAGDLSVEGKRLYRADGTDVAIADGGTGASTAYGAKDALTVKGSDIASASTTDLAAATGEYVHVTGTTTITALGTAAAGVERVVRFSGALTLTHNATSLILPTGANITTAANDVAIFRSEGSGNWRCTSYLRADGSSLSSGGSTSATWTKYTKTYSDFSTAGTTNTLTLLSLSDTDVIHAVVLWVQTAFSGGAIATYDLTLRRSSTAMTDTVDGTTAGSCQQSFAKGRGFVDGLGLDGNSSPPGTSDFTIRATSTGANLNAATAGSVDIWILRSTLP